MVVGNAGPLSRCLPQLNGGDQPVLGQRLPRLCLEEACIPLRAAQQSLPVLWPRGERVLPLRARVTEALCSNVDLIHVDFFFLRCLNLKPWILASQWMRLEVEKVYADGFRRWLEEPLPHLSGADAEDLWASSDLRVSASDYVTCSEQ